MRFFKYTHTHARTYLHTPIEYLSGALKKRKWPSRFQKTLGLFLRSEEGEKKEKMISKKEKKTSKSSK